MTETTLPRTTLESQRTDLMKAALSASPVSALEGYSTSDLRHAAQEAEEKLMHQMMTGEGLYTVEEQAEGLARVQALNIITREVMRRDMVAATAGPQGVCYENGVRLSVTVLAF